MNSFIQLQSIGLTNHILTQEVVVLKKMWAQLNKA